MIFGGNGMGIKKCVILLIILTLGLLPFFTSVSADDSVTINIHMLGEDARTRLNNPVIVAGIWHFINVTLGESASQELSLKLYQGSSLPSLGQRDETNYYEWKYSVNTQQWSDLNEYEGYSYINASNCKKSDNIYSFCVGLKDTLPEIMNYYENWTLVITKDSEQVYSKNIILEKPLVGLARSHADLIRFYLDPFTVRDVDGDDYFIIENVGNIPISLSINYGAYSNILEVAESGRILSPYSTFNHYITLNSESWKPGILEISGSSSGSIPSYLIITTAVITFETFIEINAANLEVYVGHSNYKIEEIPGTHVVFQYEESIEMNEGQIRDLTVYISGDGNITLDISSDEVNVEILKITSEDQEGTPMTIASTNASEYAVTVRIEAIRENKVGIITYELDVDGETKTYTTEVTILQPLQGEKSEETTLPVTTIIVVLCVIFVFIYIISAQIRYRRR